MPTSEITERVDARGQTCPMPIVNTAKAMRLLAPGAVVEVLATDPGSVRDFAAWARTTGNPLIEQTMQDGVYRFVLRKA
jgi:tRNA 2-thiouridine synthesizing protein A